ncbi:MAG TPA: hypothetical protein VHA52_00325, partial [Candidatus Babeliaceae bacterium]|nr:hypothetical protein [Candidatus Babeliaceae bacterium]
MYKITYKILLILFTGILILQADIRAGLCECHLPKRSWAQEKNQVYPGVKDHQACSSKCIQKGGTFVAFYESQPSEPAEPIKETEKEIEEIEQFLKQKGYTSKKQFEDMLIGLIQQIDALLNQPHTQGSAEEALRLHNLLSQALALYNTTDTTDPALKSSIQDRLSSLTEIISQQSQEVKQPNKETPKETNDKNALESALRYYMDKKPQNLLDTELIGSYLFNILERYKSGNFNPDQKIIDQAENYIDEIFKRYTKELYDQSLTYFINQNPKTKQDAETVLNALFLITTII